MIDVLFSGRVWESNAARQLKEGQHFITYTGTAKMSAAPQVGTVLAFEPPVASWRRLRVTLDYVEWDVFRQRYVCTAQDIFLTELSGYLTMTFAADRFSKYGLVVEQLKVGESCDTIPAFETETDEVAKLLKQQVEDERQSSSREARVVNKNHKNEIVCCSHCGRDTRNIGGVCSACLRTGKSQISDQKGRRSRDSRELTHET